MRTDLVYQFVGRLAPCSHARRNLALHDRSDGCPVVKRAPLKRRAPRPQRDSDPRYLAWLRTQACIICHIVRYIEAAHVGARGLGQKCSDREAVPLCQEHHRTGAHAHHVLGKGFWAFHHVDRQVVIAVLIARYEGSSVEIEKAEAESLNALADSSSMQESL